MKKVLVACYDIRNPKCAAARVSWKGSENVCKSVFECWLTHSELDRLHEKAGAEMDPNHDSLRLYHLCEDCMKQSEDHADTRIQRIQQYYIV